MGNEFKVELVVSSPLTRTLETTAGLFGTNSPNSNNNHRRNGQVNENSQILMHGHDEILQKNDKRPLKSNVKIKI